MVPPPYNLLYAPATRLHVRAIEAKYYSLIRQTIEQQLSFQPDTPTRNRKPLKRAALFGDQEATWELRFGPSNMFRVFYTLGPEENTVAILAIGVKNGNRLFIGNTEISL
jgi:mRNA-degrading endonuclease RelE of RelBE toxin-antitoxin system